MAVYNGERYLADSIESVLAQAGVDFEFVVVDDGSSDSTPKILGEYAKRDNRIRVIPQENTGLTVALNRACAAARGPLLARQDADDISRPGRLAILAEALRSRPHVAVVSSWTELVGPEGEFLLVSRFPVGEAAATTAVLVERRNVAHAASMFRKVDFEKAGGYRPEFYFAQDVDLWLRMADVGQFLSIPAALYAVRISNRSLTSRYRNAQIELLRIAHALRSARREGRSEAPLLAEAEGLRPGRLLPEKTTLGVGSWFIARALIRNRDQRARRYAQEYVRLRPLNPKGWVCLLQASLI